MNKETRTFDLYVINAIIANNEFGITNVNSLTSIKSMSLDREQYTDIKNLILEKKFDIVRKLPFGKNEFEFLEILEFLDQSNRKYVVTVYSNNALESDPQVIDIFTINDDT